jgi:hypothetical protein
MRSGHSLPKLRSPRARGPAVGGTSLGGATTDTTPETGLFPACRRGRQHVPLASGRGHPDRMSDRPGQLLCVQRPGRRDLLDRGAVESILGGHRSPTARGADRRGQSANHHAVGRQPAPQGDQPGSNRARRSACERGKHGGCGRPCGPAGGRRPGTAASARGHTAGPLAVWNQAARGDCPATCRPGQAVGRQGPHEPDASPRTSSSGQRPAGGKRGERVTACVRNPIGSMTR